jgi:transposase
MWLKMQPTLHFNEAVLLAKAGQNDAAIKSLEAALALAEPNAEFLGLLAKLYGRVGRLVESRRVWQQCLDLDPEDATAPRGLRTLRVLEEAATAASRLTYRTDLSDPQWDSIRRLLPDLKPTTREVVNAIRYHLHTGCSWALLPHDFPPATQVARHYRAWVRDGEWARVRRALRGTERASSRVGQGSE